MACPGRPADAIPGYEHKHRARWSFAASLLHECLTRPSVYLDLAGIGRLVVTCYTLRRRFAERYGMMMVHGSSLLANEGSGDTFFATVKP